MKLCDWVMESHVLTNRMAGEMTSEGGEHSHAALERTGHLQVASIAVTLEKIKHCTGNELVDELIALLRSDDFDINMFRATIRDRDDCRIITENVIKNSIERNAWKS